MEKDEDHRFAEHVNDVHYTAKCLGSVTLTLSQLETLLYALSAALYLEMARDADQRIAERIRESRKYFGNPFEE